MNTTTSTLLEQGFQALSEWDLDTAEALFIQEMRDKPDSPKGYIGLSRVWLLRGKPHQAFDWAQKASVLPGQNGDSIAMKAVCQMAFAQDGLAKELLEKCLQDYPKNTLALSNYAKILTKEGSFELAKTYTLQALEQSECKEELYHNLAVIALELGDYKSAVQALISSIEANPTYVPSYLSLSQLASKLGLVDVAIDIYEGGLGFMPNMFPIREELYNLRLLKEDVEGAMEEAMYLARYRGLAGDYVRVGNTALLLSDKVGAKISYETATQIAPNEPDAYINLGHLHRVCQERSEAMNAYIAAADAAPSSYKPYLGVALCYMELDKDFGKAYIALLKALEFAPDCYDIVIHLAICCQKLRQSSEAKKYARIATALSEEPAQSQRAQKILQGIR